MPLTDRPAAILRWTSDLSDALLKALGHFLVVSAEIEEALHRIYWKHAGLTDESGPVVTDNLGSKRLAEDIVKLAKLAPSKAEVAADLQKLMQQFNAINTKRNHCVHWLWAAMPQEQPDLSGAAGDSAQFFKVKRPAHWQKGIPEEEFRTEDIEDLVNDCCWLHRRLVAHAMPEDDLRNGREEYAKLGGVKGWGSFADFVFPAPWLDKSPQPEPTQSPLPAAQKPPRRRP